MRAIFIQASGQADGIAQRQAHQFQGLAGQIFQQLA